MRPNVESPSQIHAQESRVIGMIKHLRLEGLTYRKIAEILTEMKIPTKKRGQKWHPEMVRRILEM